ncbi:MAG: hypothetical protein ACRC3H_16480 [Lachnospiraceae bacterium]
MILFILDINTQQKRFAKMGYIYLLISLFCLLFGAVYEHFSHEVYSAYMIYAFAFPLVGGTFLFLSISLFVRRHFPGRAALKLYHAGIATLTVGSIMEGVMEIYGTTNDMLWIYWFVGFGFAGIGLLLYVLGTLSA